MAEFIPAFQFMLPHEGGYANDPHDGGGRTKFGISQRTYPDLDIESLTIAEAEAIYRRDFWEPNHLGAIDSQRVASKVFDLVVNMGSHGGIKVVQDACVGCGWDVVSDGKMGPRTLNAINQTNEQQLMSSIRAVANDHYLQLAEKNSNLKVFVNGWLKRANDDPIFHEKAAVSS